MTIEAHVRELPYQNQVSVYILNREPAGFALLRFDQKEERAFWERYSDDEASSQTELAPSMKFPRDQAGAIQAALVEAFTKLGIEPSSTQGLRGKLEATERHLADMRHLVFK